MVIDKIGNISNIAETKKSKPAPASRGTGKNDSVQISSEARKAAEMSRYLQTVRETPDVRTDRINAIKEQVQNGTYDFESDKVLEMVADKIASRLLRQ